MARTIPETTVKEFADQAFDVISREGAVELLDELAQEYLGVSGDEFVRHYRAGEIEDSSTTNVMMLAMMIPLTEQ